MGIKKIIQQKLNNVCYDKYADEVLRQEDCYRQWYLHNEDWKKEPVPAADPEIIIFADQNGIVEEKAAGIVAAFFRAHPYVQIAYGDEDLIAEKRYAPWFKPEWSPDTLDSFQYFGHFFAVRRELLAELPTEAWEGCLKDCSSAACYELLRRLTGKVTAQKWIRANEEQKAIMPIGKVLIHMQQEAEDVESAQSAYSCQVDTLPEVSIIIPSKDNPQVLGTRIASIREKTALDTDCGLRLSMEIIVVDNGSSPENRGVLEEMAQQYDFCYLYEPMPFNFSRMCNLGAEKAGGEYLLFLNDDMEIIQTDWLLKLFEKAALPHAGAVGAKLLYPDSDVIQHIGITNIKVGPVHKLLKQDDKTSYYHGQNRHIYDMIGVTAACLLVSRDKFREAGGLYEGMAVAYNDVDFCFALYDLGYYNILRNDVVLYHHESLSRGDDNLSDEKWVRLLQEKDILYTRHPHLKSEDPFYSRNLAVHSNLYLPAFLYEFEKREYYTKVRKWRGRKPEQWENGCLIVNVEHARIEKKLEFTERDDVYWIEGWSYVLGMDNCRYQRRLLLHGSNSLQNGLEDDGSSLQSGRDGDDGNHSRGTIYEVDVLDRYRRDVVDILPEQKNVALAGFVCRIPKGALPPDTYTVSMLVRDRCSNQKLYQMTEKSVMLC